VDPDAMNTLPESPADATFVDTSVIDPEPAETLEPLLIAIDPPTAVL
jgi:hypothetical protein